MVSKAAQDYIAAEVTYKNTGNAAHNFRVGFSLIGPTTIHFPWAKLVNALSPGETSTVILDDHLPFEAELPEGNYDALVSVYEKDDGQGQFIATVVSPSGQAYEYFEAGTGDLLNKKASWRGTGEVTVQPMVVNAEIVSVIIT